MDSSTPGNSHSNSSNSSNNGYGSSGGASEWVPNETELSQALQLLLALRDPARQDHSRALASLTSYASNVNFGLIMLHIFAYNGQNASHNSYGVSVEIYNNITLDLRQLAGLIVKNYVFPSLNQLPNKVQTVVKREVLQVLNDSNHDIRRTAAILVGKISESFPISTWTDMLLQLLSLLDVNLLSQGNDSNNYFIVIDGVISAVQHICEDSSVKLSLDDANRPLDVLIPKLLQFLTCSELSFRLRALESYNCLLYLLSSDQSLPRQDSFDESTENNSNDDGMEGDRNNGLASPLRNASHPLITNINTFISILSQLASDNNPEIRKNICSSITIIASMHVSVLEPYFLDIVTFMLNALKDENEAVAIESCEFFSVLLQRNDTKRVLKNYLEALIDLLIARLVLTQEQMETERIDEEEENSGEKEINIKPLHYRNTNRNNPNGSNSNNTEEEELSNKWTLRKQAALLLDDVSINFAPEEILSIALPIIQNRFNSSNVMEQESGMLALGALSTGCLDDMLGHLPQLLPFLLNNLTNDLPEMRAICCWVLSRYSGLFCDLNHVDDNNETLGTAFYEKTLTALVHTMFDNRPRVQVAACSALCLLIENSFTVPAKHISISNSDADEEINILKPYVTALLTAINKAFTVYGVKSTLLLIDTIGTLAENAREEIKNPQLVSLFLPHVIHIYSELEDFDMRNFPIMECLTYVLSAIGMEAQAYVGLIYGRCLRVLMRTLLADKDPVSGIIANSPGGMLRDTGSSGSNSSMTDNDEDDEAPKDFAIGALDVMSALCEGLGPMFPALVGETVSSLYQVIFAAIKDIIPEVRQGGFSIAGEIVKNCFSIVTPEVATELINQVLINLEVDYPLVFNNAIWTAGELSMQVGGEFMAPFVNRLLNMTIMAMQTPNLQDNILVNIATTIGRLGIILTDALVNCADDYFADWCSLLTMAIYDTERIHAFTGLVAIINKCPPIVLENKTNLFSFLKACLSWEKIDDPSSQEVMTRLREIIVAAKSHNGDMFIRVISKFDSFEVTTLQQIYHLN